MRCILDKLFGKTDPEILRDLAVVLFMLDEHFCGAGLFDKRSDAYRMIVKLRDAAAEYYPE